SAGEFGGICANMYNGGGNMAECLIFGQVAGKNAAKKKDPLDAYVVEAVVSDEMYTLGKETDLEEGKSYETTPNQYLGKGAGIGGDIVVRVTVNGGKIDNIEVLDHSETPDRGGKALELLQQKALDAQSAQIDVVSGATVTSDAFKAAVEEALSQAK
ncbi:MAG: FMN-binding protein, partial [Gordonibacter sp.]